MLKAMAPSTRRACLFRAASQRTLTQNLTAARFHRAPPCGRACRGLRFEPLERRLLLSADVTPFAGTLDDGLDRFALWAEELEDLEELAASPPIIGESLGEILDLGESLRNELIDPVRTHLNTLAGATSPQQLAAFVDNLDGTAGGGDVTATGTAGDESFQIDVSFLFKRTLAGQPLDLGEAAEPLGLDLGTRVDFTTTLDLQLGVGVDEAEGLSPAEAFFIDADSSLSVSGALAPKATDFKIELGLLGGIDVSGATIALNPVVDVTLVDPDDSGRITLVELDGNAPATIATLAPGTPPGGAPGFAVTLPYAASLGGTQAASGQITTTLDGALFTEPDIAINVAEAELLDFARVTPIQILGMFGELGARMQALAGIFDDLAAIRFLSEPLSAVANYSQALGDIVADLSLPGLEASGAIDFTRFGDFESSDIDFTIEITAEGGTLPASVAIDSLDLSAASPEGVRDALQTALNGKSPGTFKVVLERDQLVIEAANPAISDLRLTGVSDAAALLLGFEDELPGVLLPIFATFQGLAGLLNSLPEVGDTVAFGYDPGSRSATFGLDVAAGFERDVALAFAQLLDLGGFGELALTGSAVATFAADAKFDVGAGIELAPITDGTSLNELNGGRGVRLASDGAADLMVQTASGATFPVSLAGVTDVAGLKAAVANQSDLGSGALVELRIDPTGNGFELVDLSTVGEGMQPAEFRVTPTAFSGAAVDLGFGFGATDEDGNGAIEGSFIRQRFFIDAAGSPGMSASASITAEDIDLAAALGFLEIKVENGQLGGSHDDFGALDPLAYTVGLGLQDPDTSGRIFLTELARRGGAVNDITAQAVDTRTFVSGSDLLIELSSGQTFEVDLTTEGTVGAVVAKIIAEAPKDAAGDPLIQVFPNIGGTGIVLRDLSENKAIGELTLRQAVADEETVTIGKDVYEFDTVGGVSPGHIAVDVSGDKSPAAALDALIAAIDAQGTEGVNASDVTGDGTSRLLLQLDQPGEAEPEIAETLGGFGNDWTRKAFRIAALNESGAAAEIGFTGINLDRDGDGILVGDALVETEFLAAASPNLTLSGGELLLPLVVEDAGAFGLSDEPIFIMVGFEEGSILPKVAIDDAQVQRLVKAFQNLSSADLLQLARGILEFLNERFDLFNKELPLLDASLNDIVGFVSDALDTEILNAFADVQDKLTALLDEVEAELDTGAGGVDVPGLSQVPQDIVTEVFTAFEALQDATRDLERGFDVLTSEAPSRLISAFFALQAGVGRLQAFAETSSSSAVKTLANNLRTKVGEIADNVPSSETLLRLVQEALGFALPKLEDGAVKDAFNAVISALETARDDLNARLADLGAAIDGLDPPDTEIENAFSELEAALDAALTGADSLADILNGLGDALEGADILDVLATFPKLADAAAAIAAIDVDDLFSGVDTSSVDSELDDVKAELTALLGAVSEDARGKILEVFGNALLTFDFDTAAGELLVSLHLDPGLFTDDTNAETLLASKVSADFAIGDTPIAGVDLQVDQSSVFELGGHLDVGFAVTNPVADEFAFALLESSRLEVTLGFRLAGKLGVSIGSFDIALGDLPDTPAVIRISDIDDSGMEPAPGGGPALFRLSLAGSDAENDNERIALSDLDFETQLDAFLSVDLPVFVGGSRATVDTDDPVSIDFGALLDETLAFEVTGDFLSDAELDAIFGEFTEFNLANILGAFRGFLDLLAAGLDGDFVNSLPVLGSELGTIGQAIESFNSNVVGGLATALESFDGTTDDEIETFFQTRILDLFGSLDPGEDDAFSFGLNPDFVEMPGNFVHFSGTDINDQDATLEIDPLPIGFFFSESVDFDLGLDALAVELATSGGVRVDLNAFFNVGFGTSTRQGFFLVLPDDGNVVTGTLDAAVTPETEVGLELFVLGVKATPWITGDEGSATDGPDEDEPLDAMGVVRSGEGVKFEGILSLTTGNPGGRIGIGELASFDLTPEVGARLDIDLFLQAGAAASGVGDIVDENLPTFEVYLNVDWNFATSDSALLPEGMTTNDVIAPTVEFIDATIDLGKFLSGPIGEALDSIRRFTSPLNPVFDLLDLDESGNHDVPVISQLSEIFTGQPLTFLDAIRLLGTGSETVARFIDIVTTIDEILDTLASFSSGDSVQINFGDLVLYRPEGMSGAGIDLRDAGNQGLLSDFGGFQEALGSGGALDGASNADASDVSSKVGKEGFLDGLFNSLGELGIELPLLKNPSLAFGFFLGQRPTLVSWDIPRLEADFGFSQTFGPLLPPAPLFVTVGGAFGIFADFEIGYDLRGLETNDFFDGFFFDDRIVDGTDLLEAGVTAEFSAEAYLTAVVAKAGVKGGIEAVIGANWNDPDADGKVYFDELSSNFQRGLLCVFDIEGALTAFLRAAVKLGFDTPFGFVTLFQETFELLRETLLDFNVSCPPLPPPQPATNVGGGDVRLNIGEHAGARQPGASDGDEVVEIVGEQADPDESLSLFTQAPTGAQLDELFDEGFIDRSDIGETDAPFNLAGVDVNNDGEVDVDEVTALTDFNGNNSKDDDWILVTGFGEWQIFRGVDLIFGDGGNGEDEILVDAATVAVRAEIGGGSGNDKLTGSSVADLMVGGVGEDLILGFDGNDDIHGDARVTLGRSGIASVDTSERSDDGNDTIFGGLGLDDVRGGGGDDRIRGGEEDGNDTKGLGEELRGGSGQDDIAGNAGDDLLAGDSGPDHLVGGDGRNRMFGGPGGDLIVGGFGADTIFGGTGNDIIFGEFDGVESESDVANQHGDQISGDSGNDTIRAQLGADTVLGGDGDDLIIGGVGDDRLFGRGDADDIWGDRRPADLEEGVSLGAGNDEIQGGAARDVIHGGAGADRIIGGAAPGAADTGDVIFGEQGNDIVLGDNGVITDATNWASTSEGGGGSDVVRGGPGDDQIVGGEAADILFGDDFGGTSEDLVVGDQASRGGTTITAGTGADNGASDGNDFVIGYGGDDLLIGSGGGDRVFGNQGNDLVAGDYVRVLLKAGAGLSLFQQVNQVTSIATATGGDDRLFGDAGTDIVVGGAGADTIFGGSDSASGGDLRDIVLGDNGDVHRDDGTGNANDIFSTAPDDAGVDSISGGRGKDIIIGGGAGDTLAGQSDADVVLGDYGDVLRDGAENVERVTSTFTATGGRDTMQGNAGDDVLVGGTEADIGLGDTGADVLVGDNGQVRWDVGSAAAGDDDIATIDRVATSAPGIGGADVLFGHAGNDIAMGGADGDFVFGDLAAATIGFAAMPTGFSVTSGAAGRDILAGDNGLLRQFNGAPLLLQTTDPAQGGNDFIEGHDLADVILGGAGRDLLHGEAASANIALVASAGGDTLLGDNGSVDWDATDDDRATIDVIRTSDPDKGGADAVFGNAGADVAMGGAAGDLIWGDASADAAINGATGFVLTNPLGAAAPGADMLLGDNGRLVRDSAMPELLQTTSPGVGGSDHIAGHDLADVIMGGAAGDTLYGEAAVADLGLVGTPGQDAILGDNGALSWVLASDTIAGRADVADHLGGTTVTLDPDRATLDRITTTAPTDGGADTILGNADADLVFGGTAGDRIWGDDAAEAASDGDDLVFGDHGKVYPSLPAAAPFFVNNNFFAIDTLATDSGAGDLVFGNGGNDIILGQQGDDVVFGGTDADDILGGHNVSGGEDDLDPTSAESLAALAPAPLLADLDPADLNGGDLNDVLDGDAGQDVIAGDNAIVIRQADVTSPRFRALANGQLHEMTSNLVGGLINVDVGFAPNVTGAAQADPNGVLGRDVTLLDHSRAIELAAFNEPTAPRLFGNDVIAGNAGADELFGELGDDIVQGDGEVALVAPDAVDPFDPTPGQDHASFVVPGVLVETMSATHRLRFAIFEAQSDGDDYIEGNGGNDRVYGGLGQDDIVGGSSTLFGLAGAALRPDGADLVYGGAADPDRLARNAEVAAGDATIAFDERHARDADAILGDNGNIFRVVDATTGQSLAFNYDQDQAGQGLADDGYSVNRPILPRAVELVDYAYAYDADTLTFAAIGQGDVIRGETGDDIMHAMTGDDLVFGGSEDDDVYGEQGADYLLGGTGRDGILGDDGLIRTSRNVEKANNQDTTLSEPLYGIARLDETDEAISTPGNIQQAVIHRDGALKKAADLIAFRTDDLDSGLNFNDIVFGGLGSDRVHAGDGDDAVSGAEALAPYFLGGTLINEFLRTQQAAPDDAPAPAPAAKPFWFDFAPYNPGDILRFEGEGKPSEFALYDEFEPRRKVLLNADGTLYKGVAEDGFFQQFLLNFDAQEGPADTRFTPDAGLHSDGDDRIFGDLDNDWIVGGTGRDHLYGGRGDDLTNMDDDHDTTAGTSDPFANDTPDAFQEYADIAYPGAGRDVLLLNTGADRAIDWVGEFNSYITPFSPFGAFDVSRTLQPQLQAFLYDLSAADGADLTVPDGQNFAEDKAFDARIDEPGPLRNGEPYGELGLVLQQDIDWNEQTGAPADPQAGNIQGPREIMRRELFLGDDAAALAFAPDSGDWTLTGGAYQAAPVALHDEAVSLYFLDEVQPDYMEILATVNADKDKAGLGSNAYIVFDYQSKTDFKFAGLDLAINKVQIGHRTLDGWVVDVQSNLDLRANTNYAVLVALQGTLTNVYVDGARQLDHDFADTLNDGFIGLATDSAVARFDNFQVQKLPPLITYEFTADFTAADDTLFTPRAGEWQLAGGQWLADAGGRLAAATIQLDLQPFSRVELETTLETGGLSGLVFDYYGADEFKLAGIDAKTGEVVVGHVSDGRWRIDARADVGVAPAETHHLSLSLLGGNVSVSLDGQAVLGHVFNSLLNDGDLGLFTQEAARFADAAVRGDDPQFANSESQNLTALGQPVDRTSLADALTMEALEPVAAAAVARVEALIGATGRFDDVVFAIVDLPGQLLGRVTAEGTVLLDATAAGLGWFVDATPHEDGEFASADGDATGRIDLLSVVAHELGHLAGLDHDAGWMAAGLEAGTRPIAQVGEAGADDDPAEDDAGTLLFDPESGGFFRDGEQPWRTPLPAAEEVKSAAAEGVKSAAEAERAEGSHGRVEAAGQDGEAVAEPVGEPAATPERLRVEWTLPMTLSETYGLAESARDDGRGEIAEDEEAVLASWLPRADFAGMLTQRRTD